MNSEPKAGEGKEMKNLIALFMMSTLVFACCSGHRAQRSYWTGKFTKEEAERIASEELVKCCSAKGCLPSEFPAPTITSSDDLPWIFIYESKVEPYHSVSIYIDKSGGVECSHSSATKQ